jgi:hypothetical protein
LDACSEDELFSRDRLKVLDDERRSRIKGLCLKDEAA